MSRCLCMAITGWLLLLPAYAAPKWREYTDCKLLDNAFNDGDSFHVQHENRHYLFRLCYVDAPETETSLPDRVKAQAEYWDIEEKTCVRVGKDATRFTRKFLKDGFTVYTQLRDAKGRSDRKRYFAMIRVGDQYLSMALVENGLARVYGYRPDLPDGMDWKKYRAKLQSAERDAKRKGRGAWGASTSRPGIRIPEVEEQDVILPRSVAVYSLDGSNRRLCVLPKGTEVRVLGAESAFNVRIRYDDNGEPREGKCRKNEAGL